MTSEKAKKYEEQAKAITGILDDTRFDGMYDIGADKSREAGLLYEKAYDAGFEGINLQKADHFLRNACYLESSRGIFVEQYKKRISPYYDFQNARSHEDLVRVCSKMEL
jgi:hypothetical protein